MWQEFPLCTITPGLQMHLHPSGASRRDFARSVVTLTSSNRLTFHILGNMPALKRTQEVTARSAMGVWILELTGKVVDIEPSANLVCLSVQDNPRRRLLRMRVRVPLTTECSFIQYQMLGQEPFPRSGGTVLDVSSGGVKLASSESLASDLLSVSFDLPSGEEIHAECSVRHTIEPKGDDPHYHYGLKFVLIELQSLQSIDLLVGEVTQR